MTSRLAAIMVKESRDPIDNRRSLSSKNCVVISDDEKSRERSPVLDGEKGKKPALDRENMRGELWLERTGRER
ncbi:hypothetical protein TNCV_3484921 [Trichonephila clavipes]|nr:hypothetical protein TNCV_3484921 [Trichonephila clavipes]